MRIFQRLLLILLIIGGYSCKKDSDDIVTEFPMTYESYLISESEIKVYTKEGELSSPCLKNKIIERYKKNLTDLENIEIDGKVVAKYFAKDTVKLTIDKNEEEQVRLVYEKNGIIYWEKQDTLKMPVYFGTNFYSKCKYKPLYYVEYDVPKAKGYDKEAKYKECFYVKKKNLGFEVPMFDFVYKTVFGEPATKEINNEFNESYLTLIGDNDTIIIQKYNIEMKISR